MGLRQGSRLAHLKHALAEGAVALQNVVARPLRQVLEFIEPGIFLTTGQGNVHLPGDQLQALVVEPRQGFLQPENVQLLQLPGHVEGRIGVPGAVDVHRTRQMIRLVGVHHEGDLPTKLGDDGPDILQILLGILTVHP